MTDATEFAPPCSQCRYYWRRTVIIPGDPFMRTVSTTSRQISIEIVPGGLETPFFIGICTKSVLPSAEMRAFGGDCGPIARMFEPK